TSPRRGSSAESDLEALCCAAAGNQLDAAALASVRAGAADDRHVRLGGRLGAAGRAMAEAGSLQFERAVGQQQIGVHRNAAVARVDHGLDELGTPIGLAVAP